MAGPDEDAFTFLAAAWEQLSPAEPGASRPRTVHLVGAFPPVVEWSIAALLGHPVELVLHPGGVQGAREVLGALEGDAASTFPQLLLAAELPERAAPGPGPPRATGAGAFALRFGAGPALSPEERALLLEGPDLILGARALLASRGNGRASSPAARSPRPLALDSVRPFVDAPPAVVSEGAYVPRARYLENLPSRWRLVAERCARCSSLTFPARGVCRSCSAREGLTEHPLPLDGGRVVATTTIGQGGQPTEFDLQVASLGDYGVVLVELAPGIRLTLQVTDGSSADLPIGARVSTRLRRLYPMDGEWRYGRKAAPFEAPPSDV